MMGAVSVKLFLLHLVTKVDVLKVYIIMNFAKNVHMFYLIAMLVGNKEINHCKMKNPLH